MTLQDLMALPGMALGVGLAFAGFGLFLAGIVFGIVWLRVKSGWDDLRARHREDLETPASTFNPTELARHQNRARRFKP